MKIRKRSEIPVEDTWKVEDLYPSDEAWEQELASLEAEKVLLSSFAGRLGESGKTLLEYLTNMERVDQVIGNLANYCSRCQDVDTRNPTYQAMSGKFHSVVVGLGAACSFETPEIMAISDEKLNAFYADEPGLERYRRYLTDKRRHKEHILSPAEEKLLAAAGDMAGAPSKIYGNFANADMTYPDAVDSNGNAHPLSSGTFVLLQESEDRALRKSAYENVYRTLGKFKNTTAAILDAQGKKLKFFAEARKYPSSFEAALDGTNVPTSVYLNLIEAVHRNLDKMHRYVRLRKKLLGVDELHFYDVYSQLVSGVDKQIPFEEAKQTVYEAVAPLGEEYRAILKEGNHPCQ